MQPDRSVFVSHIREDKAIAKWLKDSLNRDFINTFEVFVSSDAVSISAGAAWLDSVQAALTKASLLITVCSPAAIHRPWINFEVGAASILNKSIIPVCHSGLIPEELPMPLSLRHGLTLDDADGVELLYSSLAREFGSGIPAQDFGALAQETRALAQETPIGEASQTDEDPAVARRLRDSLESSRYKWRSLEWVAAEAGVSEQEAADVLRADDEVRFSRGKNKRRIVGLKSRV